MFEIKQSTSAIVAENLKRIRAARQVSLASLARDSGVARATLYQMESAQGNPTIDTLFAIAKILGVTLSDLVRESGTPELEIIRASEGTVVPGQALEARLLRRFVNNGAVLELYDFTVHPGPPSENQEHPAGVFEHVLVNSGRLRAGPAESTTVLSPGDYISFRADLRHVYEALDGDVRATLLMEYPPALGPARGASRRNSSATSNGATPGGDGK